MSTFQGSVRKLRRDGWCARGLVTSEKHSQLFDTQVGPRVFGSPAECEAWLRQAALEFDATNVRIVTRSDRDLAATPGSLG
jgi:hypothetical protein